MAAWRGEEKNFSFPTEWKRFENFLQYAHRHTLKSNVTQEDSFTIFHTYVGLEHTTAV
jgi:hypothetical protein